MRESLEHDGEYVNRMHCHRNNLDRRILADTNCCAHF